MANKPPSLPVIASRYLCTVREFQFAAGAKIEVAEANARRYYIRFDYGVGVGNASVFSAASPGFIAFPGRTNLPFEVTFKDSPARCQGAWVAFGVIGNTLIITEEQYLE